MDSDVTFDVRVYRTEIYKGAKVTTYKVRWKAGTRLFKTPFRNAAQADSFRSSLLMAARRGESFSLDTGRPLSWVREEPQKSWFDLVLGYSAAKWPYAAPNHRRSIAEALTDATEVMLTNGTAPGHATRSARCCAPGRSVAACAAGTSHGRTWHTW